MAPSTGRRIQTVDLQFKPIIVQLPMCSCVTVGTCMGYVKKCVGGGKGEEERGGSLAILTPTPTGVGNKYCGPQRFQVLPY